MCLFLYSIYMKKYVKRANINLKDYFCFFTSLSTFINNW